MVGQSKKGPQRVHSSWRSDEGVARHGEGRGLVHCWADPADAHRDTEGLTLLAEKPASLPKA